MAVTDDERGALWIAMDDGRVDGTEWVALAWDDVVELDEWPTERAYVG